MDNKLYLPKCPLKFNLKEEDQQCSGLGCEWYIRYRTDKGLSQIGECAVKKLSFMYELLLEKL